MLQENHFFYGTIRDNLLLAKDGLSDAEMEDMLEKVKLGHFSLNDQVLEKGSESLRWRKTTFGDLQGDA